MRYIPSSGRQFVLQVPEDKNSYINVKNFDARGLGTVFNGKIINGVDDELSIGSIDDGAGLTLQQYIQILSAGVELQAHMYRAVGNASAETPLINTSAVSTGVDFSSSGIVSDLVKPLKYYIFAYDVSTGRMPYAVNVIDQDASGNAFTGVLDPDRWNEDQYLDLNFTRTGNNVVPIIYRVWGSRVEFLGMVGNAKIGFAGASLTSFRDFGLKEIPSWNNEVSYWSPEFIEGTIQVLGGVPTQVKRIVGKEHLKIKPFVENSQPNYLQCEAVPDGALVNSLTYQFDDEVKFIIDDTQPIRNAIELAQSSNIKEIFFPAGTYHLRDSSFKNTSEIDYSDISLRGVGEGSVIKRLQSQVSSSVNPGLLNFTGSGAGNPIKGLRFRSIVLDGNRSSTTSLVGPQSTSVDPSRYISETLVFMRFVDNVVANECRFVDAGGSGLHLESCDSYLFTNNIFSRMGRSYEPEVRPLAVYNSQNGIVQGNIFEFATDGPFFFGVDFSTINNNIIRSCGDKGVVLETSYQWNAGDNLAYSDTDSLIRSVDQYNNEYSKAPIEIRRGTALEPIYFTVTNGGESVGIKENTIIADIYALDAAGQKNTSSKTGSFKVIQTADQLEAGIFSVTLPGVGPGTEIDGVQVPATSEFSLLDPTVGQYGYMYEISATVRLGQAGRGYVPTNIREFAQNGNNYLAIQLRNSSELLSFQIFNSSSSENDSIIIKGFKNNDLTGLDENKAYQVVGVDTTSNSLLINTIPSLSPGTGVDFLGGQLFIQRSNYQIADGNIIVN